MKGNFKILLVIILIASAFFIYNRYGKSDNSNKNIVMETNEKGITTKTVEGVYRNEDDIYALIKRLDPDFKKENYKLSKFENQDKTFYEFLEVIDGGVTLNGYVIQVKGEELTVTKNSGQKYDIEENKIIKKGSFKDINEYIEKNSSKEVILKLNKSKLIYQDGKLYNLHFISVEKENGEKLVLDLYEEK